MELNSIYHGDCLVVLRTLPSDSIDCVVTSPPYWGLRDYGTANWIDGDKDCDHQIPIQEIDPKNLNNSSHNIRFIRETCYKCGAKRVDEQLGLEKSFRTYITKLCDIFDEVKRVLKPSGTCFVNLGDTYMNNSSYSERGRQGYGKDKVGMVYKNDVSVKTKSLCQIPSRFAIEMTDRGWILRNEIIWHKPNAMPSSVKDRFTVDFEKVFFFTKNKKYYFKQLLEPLSDYTIKDISRRKSFNNMGTSTEYSCLCKGRDRREFVKLDGRNKRCVWSINTKPNTDAHFATFPRELIKPMIESGCPEGGVVLDLFFGSGTTGVECIEQNKNHIGIELNTNYIEIAKKRIEEANRSKLNLFS